MAMLTALYIVPVSVIADPINKVTFPVFVRFQMIRSAFVRAIVV